MCPEKNRFDPDILYDPLAEDEGFADEEEDGENEEVEFIGLIEKPAESEPLEPEPELSPEERIIRVLASIPAQRKVMLAIIDYCHEPRTPAEVDALTNDLHKTSPSIYTPVLLRQHLQEAGALDYLEEEPKAESDDRTEAGEDNELTAVAATPSDEDTPQIEYLEVEKRPEGKWVSTAAALAVLFDVDYLADLRKAVFAEPEYAEVFVKVLRFCDSAPRNKQELNDAIDDDPALVGPPRVFNGYLVGVLDDCGALEWRPGWATTDVGKAFIEEYDRSKPDQVRETGGASNE
jgi:hypothetical protein